MPTPPRWAILVLGLGLGACAAPVPPTASPGSARGLVGAREPDGGDPALQRLCETAPPAPGNAAALAECGLAAERAGVYAEALAALDRSVAAGGPVPARLVDQGRIALEAGDVPAAAHAYQRLLDVAPGNIDALNGLGVTEDLRHHHDSARARYAQALDLSPGDWMVRSNLAMSWLMAGKADRAVDALAGADRDALAPRRARQDLALALAATGRRDDAIRVLREDVTAPEAAALTDAFVGFAAFLAGPDGETAALPPR